MKEPRELIQARRNVLSELLKAHGYRGTLEALTGHAYDTSGHCLLMANKPEAAELLPYLATMQEEMSFQKRMKYISIDGRPPMRKRAQAQAQAQAGPPPELLAIINQITGPPRPRTPRKPKPTEPAQKALFGQKEE